MNFTRTIPCADCPFRKDAAAVRLTPDRAREVGTCEGSFPCHKTTISIETDHDGNDRTETAKTVHCAGFLAYREKIGQPSQMMRIAERLGLYDARKVTTPKIAALVIDHRRQMIFPGLRSKRPRKG